MSALDDLNARVKDQRENRYGGSPADSTVEPLQMLVGHLIAVVNEQGRQIAALQLDVTADRRHVAQLEYKLGFPGP